MQGRHGVAPIDTAAESEWGYDRHLLAETWFAFAATPLRKLIRWAAFFSAHWSRSL